MLASDTLGSMSLNEEFSLIVERLRANKFENQFDYWPPLKMISYLNDADKTEEAYEFMLFSLSQRQAFELTLKCIESRAEDFSAEESQTLKQVNAWFEQPDSHVFEHIGTLLKRLPSQSYIKWLATAVTWTSGCMVDIQEIMQSTYDSMLQNNETKQSINTTLSRLERTLSKMTYDRVSPNLYKTALLACAQLMVGQSGDDKFNFEFLLEMGVNDYFGSNGYE